MNIKVKKFTNLCARSRHEGLTKEDHLEKIKLAKELVEDGIMVNNGCYDFVDKKISNYFIKTIKNYL